jgi:hypothetical protein
LAASSRRRVTPCLLAVSVFLVASTARAGSFSVTYNLSIGYSNELLLFPPTNPAINATWTVQGTANRATANSPAGSLIPTLFQLTVTGQNNAFTMATGWKGSGPVSGFGFFSGANSAGTDVSLAQFSLFPVPPLFSGFLLGPTSLPAFSAFGSFGAGVLPFNNGLACGRNSPLGPSCVSLASFPTRFGLTTFSAPAGFSVIGNEVQRTFSLGSVVPEPGTALLVGVGILAFGFWSRRRP